MKEQLEYKISVVIPTYNRHDLLKRTLKSAICQTHTNLEIIIVDDGSDISPKTIIEQFNDCRIKLYSIEHGNANIARNYGIERSTGNYIAMLDSDDLWLESHLEECLSMILATKADGIYGSLILKSTNNMNRIVEARELYENESIADYLLSTICGAQTSTLFTTSQSSKNILWNPYLISHQDYDFVIRFSEKYKLIPKKRPSVVYYSHEDSLSRYIDCNSYKIFAEKYCKSIKPDIYYRYSLDLLLYSKRTNQDNKYIEFFKKETLRYIEFLPYQMYASICNPKSFLQTVICKIKFLLYITIRSI